MKILVTGSNGLVGKSLLSLQDPRIEGLARGDVDLEDRESTIKYFSSVKPDAVIHAAAVVGGVDVNSKRPASFLDSNLRINLNVFEACLKAGVTNLISFNSTCAFPDRATYPLSSSQLHLGPPHESNFGYAHAKRTLDIQARAYSKEYGVSFRTVSPANLFGPFDNFDLSRGHVIPSLIHKAYRAKTLGTPFDVWGDGTPLREFVYAPDLAKGLLELISLTDFESVIFTHGHEVSISQVAEIIADHFDVSNRLQFDDSKPRGQSRKPSNPNEVREILPTFEFSRVEEALEATCLWFMQHYPHVRGVSL